MYICTGLNEELLTRTGEAIKPHEGTGELGPISVIELRSYQPWTPTKSTLITHE